MTNPLALVERVQTLLAQTDAPLAKLEEGLLEIQRIVASCETDLDEFGSRRKIEMTAATPAGELDKRLDALDKREREVVRRVEIAKTVRAELENRIDAAREADAAEKRQAAYGEALERHSAATRRVKEFLDRIAPEGREVMREYAESELKTAAANRDLPPGASPIPSIEAERVGGIPPAKITERRFQAFMHGRDFVGEVGRYEAHNVNGSWAVYLPSRSVQGDVVVPHCTISDYVEVTTQKHEPRPLEALASSLRVPEFAAPPPGLGRPERQVMPLSEWLRMSGEPAEQVPLQQVAAE
jgi:hypothetical protein